MSVLAALRLARAPSAALMAVGLLWGSFAGMVPQVKARIGASDAELGAALLASAVGGVLAMAAAPWLGRRLGGWRLLAPGLLVTFVVPLPALAGSVPGLAAALFAMGVAVATLDIAANVEISARETREGRHLMNASHAMYAFAFAFAAWLCGVLRQAGWSAAEILPAIALLCLALLAAIRGPVAADAPQEGAPPPAGAHRTTVLLTGVVLVAAFMGENAAEAWSALHIERTLGAAAGHGSFGPAMLGLLMGIGRLSGQVLAARLGTTRLIALSAVAGSAGLVLLGLAPGVGAALAGVALTGLGLSAVVPSVNSVLGGRVPQAQRAQALSRAWMLGMAAFFLGPAVMGGLAEAYGLRPAFLAMAGLVAVIVPAVRRLAR